MIEDVTFEQTRYHQAPARFEAGTGNIADAVGLGTALAYVEKLGIENINRYEHELLNYATQKLAEINGLRLHTPTDSSTKDLVINNFPILRPDRFLKPVRSRVSKMVQGSYF
jgi:cysteine desulfurase/selenocysteine lyase